jgi:hypothetical protein
MLILGQVYLLFKNNDFSGTEVSDSEIMQSPKRPILNKRQDDG